jgi:hypothetical protein
MTRLTSHLTSEVETDAERGDDSDDATRVNCRDRDVGLDENQVEAERGAVEKVSAEKIVALAACASENSGDFQRHHQLQLRMHGRGLVPELAPEPVLAREAVLEFAHPPAIDRALCLAERHLTPGTAPAAPIIARGNRCADALATCKTDLLHPESLRLI